MREVECDYPKNCSLRLTGQMQMKMNDRCRSARGILTENGRLLLAELRRNRGGAKALKGKKKGGSPGGGSLQSARLLAARLATDGPRLQGGGVTGGLRLTRFDGSYWPIIHYVRGKVIRLVGARFESF